MAVLAPPLTALRSVIELFDAVIGRNTIVLKTDVADCYPGKNSSGTAVPVTIDVSGTFTIPVGTTLDIVVKKLDPGTGMFSVVPATLTSTSDGANPPTITTTLTITAANHGVTTGCADFLLYFNLIIPGVNAPRTILIKAFQICDSCPTPMSDNQSRSVKATGKVAKGKKA